MQIASRQCLWRDTFAGPGTILAVEASSASMTVRIARGDLADDSDSVFVYWGDGQKSEYSRISDARHTYEKPGEYTVRISDDLRTFGFTDSSPSGAVPERDMLRELVSLGSKVTSIATYAFNNCHFMRGVMNLPNVTNIGGYAFGSTRGITDFILPSMTRLVQTSFYSGPTPTQMHADNVTEIDSRFWDYYGWKLYDLYLRNSTCAQIKAMSGFPFKADGTTEPVRFHGSDGIVLKDGTVIPN